MNPFRWRWNKMKHNTRNKNYYFVAIGQKYLIPNGITLLYAGLSKL